MNIPTTFFRLATCIFSIFCMVWLGACGSLTKLTEKPRVHLDSLQILSPTREGATLVFGVMVENPNPVAIEVDEVTYDLEVAGRALSSGRLENGARVPANNKAIVSIPVAVKYSDLFESLLQLLKNPTSPYRIKGAARIGPFAIPFEQTGEVKLPKGV